MSKENRKIALLTELFRRRIGINSGALTTLLRVISQDCVTAFVILFGLLSMNILSKEGRSSVFLFFLYASWDPQLSLIITLSIIIYIGFSLLLWVFIDSKSNNFSKKTILFLLIVFVLFAFSLNISVAVIRGLWALEAPFARSSEYYAAIDKVENPMLFLKNYVSYLPSLPMHASSHPPGPVILLWILSRLLGKDLMRVTLAIILIGSFNVIAVYLVANEIGGKQTGLYAALLYLLTPNIVLFTATSMDAFFVLFPTLTIYFFYKTLKTNSLSCAIFAGLFFALSIFMTFTVVVLGLFFLILGLHSISAEAKKTLVASFLVMMIMPISVYFFIYLATGFNLISCAWTIESIWHYEIAYNWSHTYGIYVITHLLVFFLYISPSTTRRYLKEIYHSCKRSQGDLYPIASVITLIFLNLLYGVYRGENERNWMFMVPLAIIPAAKNILRIKKRSKVELFATMTILFSQSLLFEVLFYTFW